MEPGVYRDLPRKEYEAIDAVNQSTLKHFLRSAAHAHEYLMHPALPTDAMELGTAIHMAVLEPDRFQKEYVQCPKFDRRTKEGKAAWLEFESKNPGRGYLDPEEWEQCQGMIRAIKESETPNMLIYGGGRNEVSAYWIDEDTQMPCKARIDRFTKLYGYSIILDLKSTANAQEHVFASLAARLGYHIQAAFYLDGLNAIAPMERRFLSMVIERGRPHGIQVFEMDDVAIAEGRKQYKSALAQYKECKRTNIWPGYIDGIQPLSLPRWATYSEED